MSPYKLVLATFLATVLPMTMITACGGTSDSVPPSTSARAESVQATETLSEDSEFQLRLPFTEDHEPLGIIPMGETINHPPPNSPAGHVGIDFQWEHQAPVIASVDGEVVEVLASTHQETGIFNYSVAVVTGEYIVNYTQLESVEPNITVGNQVVAGQLIGFPTPVQKGHKWHMIHWEFGTWKKHAPRTDSEGVTTTYRTTRICPVPYFTDSERERLLRIWETAFYDAKDQFPDLCNGSWKNYSSEPDSKASVATPPVESEAVVDTTTSPTVTTGVSGLAIDCTFDPEQLEISCQATGYQREDSQLIWTSTGSWATGGGYQWQFTIDDDLISTTTQVSLEQCEGSNCQTVEVSIDTSALMPAESVQDSEFQLRLPFTEDHEPLGILPMGETIHHPPPNSPAGHVGIDFQWDHQAPVIASVDGEVVEVLASTHQETGIFNYSVAVVTGEYIVNYTTLESVEPNITVGSQVVAGQLIGFPTPVQKGHEWHMIHWDFGTWEKHAPRTDPEGVTNTYTTTRICPVPYFTDSERERLLRIWETAFYGAKDQFPDLCNGPWKNYSSEPDSKASNGPEAEPVTTATPVPVTATSAPRPVLILPFTTEQEPLGIMPMGETILHPATPDHPNGHPGIDFQWNFRAEMIVAIDGEVAEIRTAEPHGLLLYTILVISGDFAVTYDVVDIYSFNPNLDVGSKVVSGQVLGYVEPSAFGDDWRSTHWGFGKWRPGSNKPNPEGVVEKFRVDWLCPVPYFSEEERLRLFRLWDAAIYPNAGGFEGAELKKRFPDVCSGPYKNY